MSKSWHLYAAATLALLMGCKQEVCDNNLDDDGNGAIDCDDDVCSADAACGPRCGDGVANAGEQCDGADLNGASCVSLGADSGTLTCNSACQFDQSQCVNGICGDNSVDPGEDCDGANLGGASCISLGLEDGPLSCDGTCQFNTTTCGSNTTCGNNLVEIGEQCDDGCLSGTPNVCEAADNGDGCSSACQTEAAPNGSLVINEVDYDQLNSDTASFVEIFNGTNATISLAGLSLVMINGAAATLAEYDRVDLSGAGSLNSGQFLVVGNDSVIGGLPGNVKTISRASDDFLQNGAPDGILLINGANQVLDAFFYEGSVATCTLDPDGAAINVTVPDTGFDGADPNEDSNAIARNTDGVDTNNGNADWAIVTPGSPGAPNP